MSQGYQKSAKVSGPVWRRNLPLFAAGTLGVTSVLLFALYRVELSNALSITAASAASSSGAGSSSGEALRDPLGAAALRFVELPVTLTFDNQSVKTNWSDLGLEVDLESVAREAERLAARGIRPAEVTVDYFAGGSRGGIVPLRIHRQKALDVLIAYKDQYDRAPVDARMDLEHRTIIPERPGYGIHVYESLALLEVRARAGAREVALAGAPIEPSVSRADLGDLDISHVLGHWETRYAPGEKDRNYNLALGAEKLNGHILMPGQEFSFNEVVGDRTEKEGYRVAHVILAGEMVDGMAGGSCQVSSTLHGAAFFAGLDIVKSLPHSRPSSYITMGLDATVVYPHVDVQLKNPYDFPVVFRYTVSQGTMRVEILGKERPWDKVAFEREILEEIPYETITREDSSVPLGFTVVDQIGFPGYVLERRRVFYRDGKKVKSQKWRLRYPPTTEYIRFGTNPSPNLEPPKPDNHHGLKPPKKKVEIITQ